VRIVNLGCGSDIHRDAWNVDFRPGPGVDSVVDLSRFPWPMRDGQWAEVRMFDFLEHFEHSKSRRILEECHRILEKDGRLVVQVPNMEILAHAILGDEMFPCFSCGGTLRDGACGRCGASEEANREAAVKRVYGGQDYVGNYHMTCFTPHSLFALLHDVGFVGCELLEVEHQRVNWNMKVSCRKAEVSLWR
jgi:SAM-dependent methyltransferase